MLFKMLGIQRSWEAYKDGMPKPRQLFVTQSRVLADRVQEHYAKLERSLAAAHLSPAELEARTPPPLPRRLMVNADEEAYWRTDMPQRFGVLEEEHFPLFLTYDHVRVYPRAWLSRLDCLT